LRDVGGIDKLNLLMDRIDDTMIDMIIGLMGAGAYYLINWAIYRKRKA